MGQVLSTLDFQAISMARKDAQSLANLNCLLKRFTKNCHRNRKDLLKFHKESHASSCSQKISSKYSFALTSSIKDGSNFQKAGQMQKNTFRNVD